MLWRMPRVSPCEFTFRRDLPHTRRLGFPLALLLALLLAELLATPVAFATEQILTDIGGRITTLNASYNLINVTTDVVLPGPGWTSMHSMAPWYVSDVTSTVTLKRKIVSGRIQMTTATACTYVEVLTTLADSVDCSVTITAQADMTLEGLYFFVYLPVADFTSGTCRLLSGGGSVAAAKFPSVTPADPHFLNGDASKAVFANAAGDTTVTLDLGTDRQCSVQDERAWGGTTYAAFTSFASGVLQRGDRRSISWTLSARSARNTGPVRLAVAPDQVRYHLQGIGGDYCYSKQSPVTSYTLTTLLSGWARTEMLLADWEPTNANLTSDTQWALLAGHDVAGSDLHAGFLLAQAIQRRGIPAMITVWHLPEWAYTDPGQPWDKSGRVVAPERWDDVLRCIGSFLLYARAQYGVEPDLFSFNEPDYGVYTLLTPDGERDAIKRVGAHLQGLGLKTCMVLGDTTSIGPIAFTQPTVADATAMQYVGALSVHSWGGATPAQYAAWGDLAASTGLPLLIAEVGVDAQAWRSPSILRSDLYALREVRLYQDILLYARPQGTMQWEFTDDYSLVDVTSGPGGTLLTPNRRFWYMKQFCNLTPHGSDALATTSDAAAVQFTAFRKTVQGSAQHVLHIANDGPARSAVLTGLPEGMAFDAVRTGEGDNYASLPPVTAAADGLHLSLGPQSLLTLVQKASPARTTSTTQWVQY